MSSNGAQVSPLAQTSQDDGEKRVWSRAGRKAKKAFRPLQTRFLSTFTRRGDTILAKPVNVKQSAQSYSSIPSRIERASELLIPPSAPERPLIEQAGRPRRIPSYMPLQHLPTTPSLHLLSSHPLQSRRSNSDLKSVRRASPTSERATAAYPSARPQAVRPRRPSSLSQTVLAESIDTIPLANSLSRDSYTTDRRSHRPPTTPSPRDFGSPGSRRKPSASGQAHFRGPRPPRASTEQPQGPRRVPTPSLRYSGSTIDASPTFVPALPHTDHGLIPAPQKRTPRTRPDVGSHRCGAVDCVYARHAGPWGHIPAGSGDDRGTPPPSATDDLPLGLLYPRAVSAQGRRRESVVRRLVASGGSRVWRLPAAGDHVNLDMRRDGKGKGKTGVAVLHADGDSVSVSVSDEGGDGGGGGGVRLSLSSEQEEYEDAAEYPSQEGGCTETLVGGGMKDDGDGGSGRFFAGTLDV